MLYDSVTKGHNLVWGSGQGPFKNTTWTAERDRSLDFKIGGAGLGLFIVTNRLIEFINVKERC